MFRRLPIRPLPRQETRRPGTETAPDDKSDYRKRSHRYDTAAGLAADIRRHLDNEPVIARPPSWGYRVQKTVRRHRSAFATTGIVLVALLLGLGFSVWQAVEKTRALARMTEAEQAQSHSREVAEKALSQEAEARRRVDELLEREKDERRAGGARVYATDIHLAQQAMDKANFDRARELLAGHYPRPGQTNRPGWEWRYLWQQLQDDPSFEVCRLTNISPPAIGVGTPGDNRWLLQGNRNADRTWIEVLDITDLHAPRHAGEIPMPSSNAISALALGNRNGLVAYAQTGGPHLVIGPGSMTTIGLYDTTRRHTLGTITNLTGYCGILSWSGDNQFLLSFSTVDDPSLGWRSRIDVWRASNLAHVTTLTNFPNRPDGGEGFVRFAANADASASAIASTARLLSVMDVATGATNWSLASGHRGFEDVALAPDGRTLFVLEDADPGRIRVFDFRTGKELSPPLMSEDGGSLGALVVASDGRTVVCHSSKGNLCLWDVSDLAHGPKALPALRATSRGFPFALLPEARTILTLSSDGTVLGWDLTRDRQTRQPVKVEINTDVANYQLRADGKALLIVTHDGAVTERHGNAFQTETPLFHLGRRLGKPIFSEDGRWFASGSTNGLAEVWNVPERRQVQKIGSYPRSVRTEQFSPDGTRLIVLDVSNERYAEWDLAASREIRTFPTLHRKEDFDRPEVLSRDGQQMLRPDGKGGVLWMDILTGAYVVRQLQPWFENLGKRVVKAPKVYVRDSGLLHGLLNIPDLPSLQAHPKLGASWEGFVIEQILSWAGERNAWFWGTHAGAELDLLVSAKGKRWGFEVKYQDAPTITKSMRIALHDLKLEKLWVIYPGKTSYRMDEKIECVSLAQLDQVRSTLK